MIECHFQTWGREVAWQGCDPLRSLSLQPLRRTELDKNWKWMQPLCSFSRRWIFVWADQTAALCPRRSRTGGTTLVHFPEQKIFIQTNSLLYRDSRLSEFPLATKWKKVTNLMGSHDGGEDGVLSPAQQQLLGPDKPKQAATCTHMRIEDRQNYWDSSDLYHQNIVCVCRLSFFDVLFKRFWQAVMSVWVLP